MSKELMMRELNEQEMSQINGGMSTGEGVAAIGVVVAATALAPATAVGAGVILAGVAAVSAFDAFQSYQMAQ
ncbi:bacteriocin [Pseudomonas syringae pv. syringae]|uniref:bacteriocin n=1 Tax=Pseudomonas syringae TaxID=317 RepID=UPI00200B0D69|nr:bacteriocin [Pseudomonas syringae]MCK9718435.1 bacteriocin [Pseudomonas syringae pv. syringae]MCK9763483.1 bacteriocin [Pseudomonas syringae pv. syringae]